MREREGEDYDLLLTDERVRKVILIFVHGADVGGVTVLVVVMLEDAPRTLEIASRFRAGTSLSWLTCFGR